MTNPTPCRAAFEECDCADLDSWIESGALPPADLTFALKTAGQRGTPRALGLLLDAVHGSESALVREGAVLGLSALYEMIRSALQEVADTDASAGVRAAAKEALAL